MRVVVQRVIRSHVGVAGKVVASIDRGLNVLVGVHRDDTDDDVRYIARKVLGLRIFEDAQGKMNLSVVDVGGKLLLVPQFTLLASTRRGRRPSFDAAAPPDKAKEMFDKLVELLKSQYEHVHTGAFREHMHVFILNDGPVTIIIDSREGVGR